MKGGRKDVTEERRKGGRNYGRMKGMKEMREEGRKGGRKEGRRG